MDWTCSYQKWGESMSIEKIICGGQMYYPLSDQEKRKLANYANLQKQVNDLSSFKRKVMSYDGTLPPAGSRNPTPGPAIRIYDDGTIESYHVY